MEPNALSDGGVAGVPRRSPSVRKTLLTALVLASVSGCGVLLPPTPNPTEPAPAFGTNVEFAVDNHANETFVMTVSRDEQQPGPASLTVGPCEAASFTYVVEEPFSVGFGEAADFADRPMPELVASEDLAPVEEGFRLLIRVSPEGNVAFEPLEGEAPLRGQGC